MAFELPIDFDGDSIEKAFDRIIGKVDVLDQKVKGLNADMGQTRTVSGRAVALPQNPADRASGLASAQAIDRGTMGPADMRGPWRGGGPRQALSREEEAMRRAYAVGDGDLIRDQEDRLFRARRAVERSDRALFIGPPEAPKRAPFAGENDFIGPMPAPKIPPDTKERITRAGRSSSTDPWGYEGPRQRAARDAAMLDRARATGDSSLIGDWEDRAKRSQDHVDRLDGKVGLGSLVNSALMRSRLNAGPLSPLMMDLAPMLGEGAMAGLGAVGGLFGLAHAGAASTERSNRAFYALGGSGANVSAAMALGGENAVDKAMGFNDALTRGSVGAGFMRSQGIQFRGRYTDFSGNYVRGVSALRNIDDVQERIRVARETGLTDDLWTSELSDSQFNRVMRSRADAGSPEARRANADYKADAEEVSGWWENTKQLLGGAASQFLVDTKSVLWDLPNAWANGDDKAGMDVLDRLADRWVPGYHSKRSRGSSNGSQNHGFQNIEPVIGNGPQSVNGTISGSIPAGLRGQAMNDFLDQQAMHLGVWGV